MEKFEKGNNKHASSYEGNNKHASSYDMLKNQHQL